MQNEFMEIDDQFAGQFGDQLNSHKHTMSQIRQNVVSFAKYDIKTDDSWGDHGETCDLKSLDKKEMKKWKLEVLHTAQEFTAPDMDKEKCFTTANKLFKLVDTNNDGIIDKCEAVKEYVAFGNSRDDFENVKSVDLTIKGQDFSKLTKFCNDKFKIAL